jgi:hypothetical protein
MKRLGLNFLLTFKNLLKNKLEWATDLDMESVGSAEDVFVVLT